MTMGLLTDPSTGSGKITKFLLKQERPICFFLYISGIVWILLLALPIFNFQTYFSENALLPGLVTKKSNLVQTAEHYYIQLIQEMEEYPDVTPYAWLVAKLNELHLDVFTHNFTLVYPFQEKQFTGQNVYGIMRAPRAASTEAIVISVPFRPLNSIYLDNAPSIAILLAFAKFCRKQRYWAKDIIFLITEHEQLGIQAWLDAYHEVTSGNKGILISEDLPGRAGSIQAAINLELHSTKISSIDVKIEGLNGRLPNLDLFNLAQHMIAKEGIRQTFQKRFDVKYKNKFNYWWYHINTLLMMIASQSTGIPTGNHGLFHRFGIEAITLEGFEKSDVRHFNGNFYHLGRIVESIVRSLNNLLERFHQSYFFYLLSSTNTYISIGFYIISVALIIAGIFVKAFCVWERLRLSTSVEDKKNTVTKQSKDDEFDIGVVMSEILWSHICGILIATSPFPLTYFGKKVNSHTEDSIYFGFVAITILTLMWPIYSRRQMKYKNAALLYVIAVIELGTILMCIAMHNFSLAFLTAVIYVPFVLVLPITPKKNFTKSRKMLSFMWVFLHPFMITSLFIMCYSYVYFFPDSLLTILFRGYHATKEAFVFSIMDSMIYGNWLYNIAVSIMFPIWFIFWNILCFNIV